MTNTASTVINKLLDIVKGAEDTINKMGAASEDPKVMMLGLEGVLNIGRGIQEVKDILNNARAQAAKEALEQLSKNPNLSDDQKKVVANIIQSMAADEEEEHVADDQERRAIEAFNRIMNEAANKQEDQDGPGED